MKTKENAINVIKAIKHPAINYSLFDLGIVKDIEINDDTVNLTFAFPFPDIPIADALINSIAQPLKNIGFDFVHKVVIMTDEEKAKFLQMETQGWKGGV